MAKVSVVVPVYKVELTLRKCIDSVINQSFTDLEIILIDDGSPDHCGQICDEYLVKDDRIKVIHKKNEGLSRARNDGIKMASGEWILFVDSDDWLQEDYVEKLYSSDLDKYSVPICGATTECPTGQWKKRFGVKGAVEITDTEMLKIVQANSLSLRYNPIKNAIKIDLIGPPWNKLYNRLLIEEKSVFFDESLEVAEDSYFNLCYLEWVNKIIVVDSYGYNYCYNSGGITKKFDERRLMKDNGFFKRIGEFAKESSNVYLKEFAYGSVSYAFILNLYRYYFASNNPYSIKKKIEILRNTLNEDQYQEAFEKFNCEAFSHRMNIVIRQAKKKRSIIIMVLFYLNKIRKQIKGC